MPAGRINQTMFIGPRSDIEEMNESSLYKGGELGSQIQTTKGKGYQLVKLDSGATASTGAGVVADGDLAFWKDKDDYLVTNDKNQAFGGPSTSTTRNAVAGVFVAAVTAGNYCVIQQRGRHDAVKTDGGGDFAVGDFIVPKDDADAIGDRTAVGTAPPVTPVGRVAAAESGGFTACDLDMPMSNP